MAKGEQQRREWGQSTELLAVIAETLSAIYQRLTAGIPVVMVKKADRPDDPLSIPRPDWVKTDDGDVTSLTPAEVFAMFRG